MVSKMIRYAFPLLLLAMFSSCESSTSDSAAVQRTTILGTLELRTLDGDVLPLPYNNVTVNLLHLTSGGGYTETALASGFWAFRNVVLDDYIAYASCPGYGRSEDMAVTSSNLEDSILLTLAEQPTVQPVLDSVLGSWDTGFTLYGHMHRNSAEQLGVLVRAVGEGSEQFRALTQGFTPVRLDSGYVVHSVRWPPTFPSHPEFALVAFNPAVGYYYTDSYAATYRYCSEGPVSNVMAPR